MMIANRFKSQFKTVLKAQQRRTVFSNNPNHSPASSVCDIISSDDGPAPVTLAEVYEHPKSPDTILSVNGCATDDCAKSNIGPSPMPSDEDWDLMRQIYSASPGIHFDCATTEAFFEVIYECQKPAVESKGNEEVETRFAGSKSEI